MKISELIEQLKQFQQKHGDIEVAAASEHVKGSPRPVYGVSNMHLQGDEPYAYIGTHVNWPSKTGNPSGKGRDNA